MRFWLRVMVARLAPPPRQSHYIYIYVCVCVSVILHTYTRTHSTSKQRKFTCVCTLPPPIWPVLHTFKRVPNRSHSKTTLPGWPLLTSCHLYPHTRPCCILSILLFSLHHLTSGTSAPLPFQHYHIKAQGPAGWPLGKWDKASPVLSRLSGCPAASD